MNLEPVIPEPRSRERAIDLQLLELRRMSIQEAVAFLDSMWTCGLEGSRHVAILLDAYEAQGFRAESQALACRLLGGRHRSDELTRRLERMQFDDFNQAVRGYAASTGADTCPYLGHLLVAVFDARRTDLVGAYRALPFNVRDGLAYAAAAQMCVEWDDRFPGGLRSLVEEAGLSARRIANGALYCWRYSSTREAGQRWIDAIMASGHRGLEKALDAEIEASLHPKAPSIHSPHYLRDTQAKVRARDQTVAFADPVGRMTMAP